MQRLKEEVKSRILCSALEEFHTKTYDGASMRDIAQKAGTSLGNLYRYYPNKEQLFLEVVNPVLDVCLGWAEQSFDFSPEGLEKAAELMSRSVAEHGEIFDILCQGPTCYYHRFLSRFSVCISEKLKSYVAGEMAGEELAILNPAFFDLLGTAFMSGLRVIMEHRSEPDLTTAYVLELLRFTFSDLKSRLRDLNR